MASTHSAESTGAATQLLDHPAEQDAARHRLPRQSRGGSPLLGVTAMTAALGATGFAASTAAQAAQPPAAPTAQVPAVSAPDLATPDEASASGHAADPGLALAARIQQQADGRSTAEDEHARLAAAQEAEAKRAAARAATADQGRTTDAHGATATLPVTDYRLTTRFAQAGTHWAHLHTGLDFAARTGTPVTAIGEGTVTAAGWTGPYGYRVIQTLPDGTELWYCHLARITTPAGPVRPGTVLGTVGATGSVTGPRLHLEVRPAGGAPVDPLAWLHAQGLNP
ncbi:hypothetical protein GCM10010441_38970 [Kitasatospora paracochleata]|uniref:Murein DD-endopeptidase MepM/ murein hydrolase activator NlpD n=1 Tax=Kitasatospora paracochleata TaxID=58354 RepID=A0ABT1IPD0_9ACTN|nr:M23 family metallopeptidase [Kitasatospora paracochleata]MCP2306979.1 murein DD-endopeptidase MepM/ murein hydrolase activator NlpD [Kitasatospora paracochleata]